MVAASSAEDSAQRAVLLGPPGSGKGTQARIVAERIGVPAISTGDMLRQAVAEGTEMGERVQGIMERGALVDDATMAEVVRGRLAQPDARRGFLLDGYPRTLDQARTLEGILDDRAASLDRVILLEVPEGELLRRAIERQREDDREEVVRRRLEVYRKQTAPLVGYYESRGLLRHVDGDRPIDEVTAAILTRLSANGAP